MTWFRDPNATVILRPARAATPAQQRYRVFAVLAAGSTVLAIVVLVLVLRPGPAAPAATLTPSAFAAADEAALLAARPTSMTILRFAPAPAILVALFPTPHAQALALNRAAVLLEMAGAPHDRVLGDEALRATVEAGRSNFDHFYAAHDYRAADLRRFWRLADEEGIALDAEEQGLRGALARAAAEPAGFGALISVPPADSSHSASARAAILKHELSHGLYFTNLDYRNAVGVFWRETLTAAQRDGFRRYLGAEGYDVDNDDLMQNETQAYLVNTPDRHLFDPAAAGLSEPEVKRLCKALQVGSDSFYLGSETRH